MNTTERDHPSRPDRVIIECDRVIQCEYERANVEGIARYRAAVAACTTAAEVRRVKPDVLPENRWHAAAGYFAEVTSGPRHRQGVYFLEIARRNDCGEVGRETGWRLLPRDSFVLTRREEIEAATLPLGALPPAAALTMDKFGEPRYADRDGGADAVDARQNLLFVLERVA